MKKRTFIIKKPNKKGPLVERAIKKIEKKRRGPRKRNNRRPNVSKTNFQKFPMGIPQFQDGFGDRQSVVISNSEYITDLTVINQPNFTVIGSYPINPGMAVTFPWLSKTAKLYEKYQFLDLCFFYKPIVSQYNAAGSGGKVIFSADYDPTEAPPDSKQNMEDSIPHCDMMAYETQVIKLSPKELHRNSDAKFVRYNPPTVDIRTSDAGVFFVAVQGISVNQPIGELRVKYRVKLSVPVLDSIISAPANYNVTQLHEIASPENGTSRPILWDDTGPYSLYANGLGLVVDGSGVITLPAGNYILNWGASGQNSTSTLNNISMIFYINSVLYTAYNAVQDLEAGSNATYLSVARAVFYSAKEGDQLQFQLYAAFTGGVTTVNSSLTVQLL
jgi:hypothetical protein